MKANELMIGDWVTYTMYEIDTVVKVCGINDKHVSIGNGQCVFQDTLMPIHLTAEILEKNGFEWMEKDIEYILTLGGTFEVRAEVVNDLMWNINVYYTRADIEFYELQFVHELQHALRLCGIEKDIVL